MARIANQSMIVLRGMIVLGQEFVLEVQRATVFLMQKERIAQFRFAFVLFQYFRLLLIDRTKNRNVVDILPMMRGVAVGTGNASSQNKEKKLPVSVRLEEKENIAQKMIPGSPCYFPVEKVTLDKFDNSFFLKAF